MMKVWAYYNILEIKTGGAKICQKTLQFDSLKELEYANPKARIINCYFFCHTHCFRIHGMLDIEHS